jgi:hypothetical protein
MLGPERPDDLLGKPGAGEPIRHDGS